MRLLWSSNAPWSTSGYGVQSRHLLPRFKGLGHDVAIFAWDGLHHGRLTIDNIDIYPGGYLPFGFDLVGEHVKHFKADLVVSVQDIWPLPEDYKQKVGTRWASWFPIDGEPAPRSVIKIAKTCDYCLCYSQHGTEQVEAAGVKCRYIPLGVETRTFYPADKRAARETLGMSPDGFLCAMVAANRGYPSRKAFSANVQAFARLYHEHPELDARLYLHTEQSRVENGIDLDQLVRALGIHDRVLFPDPYQNMIGLPETAMAHIYNAADVLLAASMGEGFGIPIIEAQACGTPVITTDFTSMSELTFNGVCTKPGQKFFTALDHWWVEPSIDNIYSALCTIVGWDDHTRKGMAEWGTKVMRRDYEWDVVVTRHWVPFFEEVEQQMAPAFLTPERQDGADAGVAQSAKGE